MMTLTCFSRYHRDLEKVFFFSFIYSLFLPAYRRNMLAKNVFLIVFMTKNIVKFISVNCCYS